MYSMTMPDGAKLAYRDSNPAAGRSALTVVCLHGWCMSGRWFDGMTKALSNTARVLVPDLRGHGDSQSGELALTVELLAEDLNGFLSKTMAGKVILVGWSMGAMVAWKAMETGITATLLGLVVIDMTPKILNDSNWTNGMQGSAHTRVGTNHAGQYGNKLWAETCRRMAHRIVSGEATARARRCVEELGSDAQRNDAGAMMGLWQSMLTQDFRNLVREAAVPTQVMYGAHSQLYPPSVSAFIVDTAPNATRIVFQNSGHAPHIEEPGRFNQSIQEFIHACGHSQSAGTHGNSKPSE